MRGSRNVRHVSEVERIEEELDRLQQESQARAAELRAIGAELPQALSRRRMVAEMARSVRDAPDRSTVARRTIAKILRTPADLVRRLRS